MTCLMAFGHPGRLGILLVLSVADAARDTSLLLAQLEPASAAESRAVQNTVQKDAPTEEQLEEYQDAFRLFDKDDDGTIGKQELLFIMRSLGKNPTAKEVQDTINEVDKDGNGAINLDEFVTLMGRRMGALSTEEEIKDAFKAMTSSRSDFIGIADMRRLLAKDGETLTDNDLRALIRKGDSDKDGRLSYEEFAKLMAN
uniref:Calmodulin n=1 Tax=Alexandrium andersonii TaxID=327968 RepID=A0A7S2ACP2_9DINO|mmetsp:Transcript_10121/g.23041  ORF Transcript_10121/g.23041 Transcript_10121/m.23041 type:complete len:199 (+) Transcript_10121:84-680(+)